RADRASRRRPRCPARGPFGRGSADRGGRGPHLQRRAAGGGVVIGAYRALLVAGFQNASQYRVQLFLYVFFSVLRPIIFLAAWVAVAQARGGSVGTFGVADFAAYYIALTIVLHLALPWDAYEVEFVVRQGRLSPLPLLAPAPAAFQAIAYARPFAYLFGVPVDILRGATTFEQPLLLLAGQVFWVAVCYLALQVAWSRGLRQYSGVGA